MEPSWHDSTKSLYLRLERLEDALAASGITYSSPSIAQFLEVESLFRFRAKLCNMHNARDAPIAVHKLCDEVDELFSILAKKYVVHEDLQRITEIGTKIWNAN